MAKNQNGNSTEPEKQEEPKNVEEQIDKSLDELNKKQAELASKQSTMAAREAELLQERKDKLEKEAATLGIIPSRTTISGARIKDIPAEQLKHEKLRLDRLEKRIENAKKKPNAQQVRRKHLEAKLRHVQDYPREQIAQAKYELSMMNQKRWRPGIKMPKKKTVYDEIMNQ